MIITAHYSDYFDYFRLRELTNQTGMCGRPKFLQLRSSILRTLGGKWTGGQADADLLDDRNKWMIMFTKDLNGKRVFTMKDWLAGIKSWCMCSCLLMMDLIDSFVKLLMLQQVYFKGCYLVFSPFRRGGEWRMIYTTSTFLELAQKKLPVYWDIWLCSCMSS